MASDPWPWERIDPDKDVDPLPQPFRSINEILEESILQEVNDHIDVLESRQKSPQYESGLPSFAPTSQITVPGRVTCVCLESPGTSRFAVGTSSSELVLIDSYKDAMIAAEKRAFSTNEELHCIAMCSDGILEAPRVIPRPAADGGRQSTVGSEQEPAPPPILPKKAVKLMAAGRETPRIHIYDVQKGVYGIQLKASCAVHVPVPEATEGEDAPPPPPVEQLRAKGVNNFNWVVALLPNRTIHAYRTPLTETLDNSKEGVASEVIREEDEEGDGEGGGGGADEFDGAHITHIKTPTYVFSLPEMASLRGMPEPSVAEITLSLLGPRPEGLSVKKAYQAPTYAFLSSAVSEGIVAYSMRAPEAPRARPGLTVDELLKEAAPGFEVTDPEESKTLKPLRHWALSGRATAVAASAGGRIFAAGTEHGAIALISTGAGPALTATLPGHYGVVKAVGFHKADVLVSVGADGWIHHYCMKTNSLLYRQMMSAAPGNPCSCAACRSLQTLAPPAPPAGEAVAVSRSRPMALSLDVLGDMRLVDLRSGKKLAKVVCKAEDPEGPMSPRAQGAPGLSDGEHLQLIAVAGSFCVLREAGQATSGGLPAEQSEEREQASQEELEGDKPPSRQASAEDEEGCAVLYFFDEAKAPAGSMGPEPGSLALVGAHEDAQAGDAESTQGGAESVATAKAASHIVELTAENLRRIGKMGATGASAMQATSLTSMADAPTAMAGAKISAVVQAGGGRAHRVPEGWQTAVKKYLGSACADRQMRMGQVQRHLRQLRKEIEQGGA
eukprot:TRINITY_DN24052_c0_g1_i1.p1 TRINITY_DN24052_c0_g1~~TRINITY_DN24052_c0_g1_i1.p1  ORF type:complete len:784 (-),score=192.71 TRINITY_DN24052_c0_g1_i1:181-2532(-)